MAFSSPPVPSKGAHEVLDLIVLPLVDLLNRLLGGCFFQEDGHVL